ncbi:hypothetical protein SUGI_0228860 [Cryptomeria japonica]|uniref:aspartyl protease AED3 n=1 Tax=Cryptomeria japonica TaxID=3369 RepID=UPI0024089DBA|nr:aspartyl protease AED3 [Cryptomeria japonica]GLJ14237.1 hypothetical protein SUGI_0228860 [Cryptomeria japonica]
MAKRLCLVLVCFLLLVCVWAENSKFARVNLASFKWKDAEDTNNCSALESETSSLIVMHIQSKCSPFRLPNITWRRAISESIKGDTQRHRAMMKEDADLPLIYGNTLFQQREYFIKLGFGTPVQSFYTLLDTGSDIAWIPCNPCSNCLTSQLFQPSESSTYNYLSCASQQCQLLNLSTCVDNCTFDLFYSGAPEVHVLLSSETLSVGSQPVEDFVFGCAVSGVIQNYSAPGLVGFGRHPLSFPSQTATLYNRTFSYCLPSVLSPDYTGSLVLGNEALSVPSLQFTPLYSNAFNPSYYYVGLNGISVGEELVSIPEGTFTLDNSTGRGTAIDSGTTITWLVESAYNATRDSFRRQVSIPTLPSNPISTLFDTCYNLSDVEVGFPLITLHFNDDLDWTLPMENSLYLESSVICLTFTTSRVEWSIIGNYQQQNFRIVYDVPGSRLGIAPENCDGSMLAQ